jgi:hypothetical protein
VEYVREVFGKQVSIWTIKRILKAAGYRWKRMRRSLKHKRNEVLFSFFQQEIEQLHELEIQGEIDVYYFDEAGVNLTPVIPYAWQQKNQRYELPSVRSQNLTILGFMNLRSQCQSFLFEGAADSEIVMACMDEFAGQITKKTVVILDRASIHTSNRMQQRAKQWQKQGLFLQFLPAYCPELNLIEILWKHVKYYWLDVSAYHDMASLKDQLTEVLENIGSKHLVSFA